MVHSQKYTPTQPHRQYHLEWRGGRGGGGEKGGVRLGWKHYCYATVALLTSSHSSLPTLGYLGRFHQSRKGRNDPDDPDSCLMQQLKGRKEKKRKKKKERKKAYRHGIVDLARTSQPMYCRKRLLKFFSCFIFPLLYEISFLGLFWLWLWLADWPL